MGTAQAERLAALFGVHYATHTPKSWPSARGLPERFRPVSVERACHLLNRPPPPGAHREDEARAHARRHALATLLSTGLDVGDRHVRALARPEENAGPLVASKAARSGGHPLELVGQVPQEPDVTFDRQTFITRVTIPPYELPVTEKGKDALLAATDPRNWAAFGSECFQASESGHWRRGVFTKGPWPPPSGKDHSTGGDFLEEVQWAWNEDQPGQMKNVLRIHDLQTSDMHVRYSYHLVQCQESQLGFGWQWGGIDVDNGHTDVRIERTRQGLVAHLSAWKELRYANPGAAPPEAIDLLNLTTPALLSLFMSELMYEGPRRLAGAPSPTVAPSPTTVRRPTNVKGP